MWKSSLPFRQKQLSGRSPMCFRTCECAKKIQCQKFLIRTRAKRASGEVSWTKKRDSEDPPNKMTSGLSPVQLSSCPGPDVTGCTIVFSPARDARQSVTSRGFHKRYPGGAGRGAGSRRVGKAACSLERRRRRRRVEEAVVDAHVRCPRIWARARHQLGQLH